MGTYREPSKPFSCDKLQLIGLLSSILASEASNGIMCMSVGSVGMYGCMCGMCIYVMFDTYVWERAYVCM